MTQGKGTDAPSKKNKKTVKVPGKKTTIGNPEGTHVTIQGPSTLKTDLKGGALDEVVAPIAENLRNTTNEMLTNLKESGKRVKRGIYNYFDRPRNGKSKYTAGS
tara:strand:+ start:154 stop:465 length:312 start_codon:yes stop_codon:yes gene_type:complete